MEIHITTEITFQNNCCRYIFKHEACLNLIYLWATRVTIHVLRIGNIAIGKSDLTAPSKSLTFSALYVHFDVRTLFMLFTVCRKFHLIKKNWLSMWSKSRTVYESNESTFGDIADTISYFAQGRGSIISSKIGHCAGKYWCCAKTNWRIPLCDISRKWEIFKQSYDLHTQYFARTYGMLCAGCLPHLLTDAQKNVRVDWCRKMVSKINCGASW